MDHARAGPSTHKSGLALGLSIAGGGALALSAAIVLAVMLIGGKDDNSKQVVNQLPNVPPAKPSSNVETEERQREAEAKAPAAIEVEEKRRREAELSALKAKAEAEATLKAEAQKQAAARLADLKAKLSAAQAEAKQAEQQAKQARDKANDAVAKAEQAERNYRNSRTGSSPGPAVAAGSAEARRHIQEYWDNLRDSQEAANALQIAKELVEKAKQAEQLARQAAIAAAKAQAAVRQAEQAEQLKKSDSELGGVPRSEHFVGRWRIVNDEGITAAYFTLKNTLEARKDHAPNAPGKWQVVGEEVRITWSDGWRDLFRPQNGEILVISYGPGAEWDKLPAKPVRTQRAVKMGN
jgi:hypothetical protein